MDEALGQIVAGTYDIEGAASEGRRQAAIAAKTKPLMAKAEAAYAKGEWETVITSLQGLAELDPDEFGGYAIEAFKMMFTKLNDAPRAYGYANKMIAGACVDKPEMLNAVAWVIVSTDEIKNPDLDVASKAINLANKLTNNKDPMVLDTLATVYYLQGKIDKDVETQRKAISLADPETAKQLKPSLDKYLAAANEG